MARSVGEYFNSTDGFNDSKNQPVLKLVYVHVGDIGADYVVGSEGQIKSITYYVDTDKTIVSGIQTFKYTDTVYPTKVTDIISEEV